MYPKMPAEKIAIFSVVVERHQENYTQQHITEYRGHFDAVLLSNNGNGFVMLKTYHNFCLKI